MTEQPPQEPIMSSELMELADRLDDAEGSYSFVRAVTTEVASALRSFAQEQKPPPAANASAEARLREAKLTSEELLTSIADQRRRYQTVVLNPDQVDLLLAEIWAERTLRVEATREAFQTGWYINAAEAGDGEDQHPADYLERCEEVDWQEYKRSALSAHPHASDCARDDCGAYRCRDLGCFGVCKPSDRTADVTVDELHAFILKHSDEWEDEGVAARTLLDAYGMWRR